MPTQAIFT